MQCPIEVRTLVPHYRQVDLGKRTLVEQRQTVTGFTKAFFKEDEDQILKHYTC